MENRMKEFWIVNRFLYLVKVQGDFVLMYDCIEVLFEYWKLKFIYLLENGLVKIFMLCYDLIKLYWDMVVKIVLVKNFQLIKF